MRKMYRQSITIVVCCVHFLFIPGPVAASTPIDGTAIEFSMQAAIGDAPAKADDARESTSDERDVASHQLTIGIVFRSRQHQLLYDRATQLFAAREFAEGLIQLQKLLEQDEDCFVQSYDRRALMGARQAALGLIQQQGPTVWQMYERLFGERAEYLWQVAQSSGDEQQIEAICRQFYLTESGFAAANWKASRRLDQGDFVTAAACFQELVDDVAHRERITPVIFFKLALAQQKCQQPTSHHVLKQIASETVRLGNRDIIVAEYLSRGESNLIRTAAAESMEPVGSPSTFGSQNALFETSHSSALDIPYLSPRWLHPCSARPNVKLAEAFAHWKKQRYSNSQPVAIANSAIAFGPLVFYRDHSSIRALNIADGQPVWEYPCHVSLEKGVAALIEQYGYTPTTDARLNELVDLYTGNSITGSMTCDGRRLYAIEDMQILPAEGTVRAISPDADGASAWKNGISRRSNRLVALPVDVAGTVTEPLWSVGGGIGPPDWFRVMDHDGDQQLSNSEFRGSSDQFREIDADNDGWINVEESEQLTDYSTDSQSGLAGHYFLGPPLTIGNRLYVMAEFHRQLKLIVLDAQTGEQKNAQRIGYVDTSIDADLPRYALSCTPVCSQGVVVCPTQKDVLVGVDETGSRLLWTYYYGDLVENSDEERWSAVNRSHGHRGFSSQLHVRDEQIIYLPRQSDRLHCVQLTTGRQCWTVDRDDAEYVGHVGGEVVVVVGRQFCRGLSVKTGEELWSLRTGMPVGRGVCQQETFLLPAEEGRVLAIDVSTGKQIGYCAPQDVRRKWLADGDSDRSAQDQNWKWELGNLLVAGDRVLSLSAGEIVGFVPAREELKQQYQQLAADEPSRDDHLLIGELELLLGELPSSQLHLTKCRDAFPFDRQALFAEHLLRESLYLQLEKSPQDCALVLEKLDQASHSASERGRYLMHRTKVQLDNGDFQEVIAAAHELAAVDLSEPLENVTDATHWVSAGSWGPRILKVNDPELTRLLDEDVIEKQGQLLEKSTIDELKAFLALYADWPQADGVRWKLAELYQEQGEYQKAELLLLRNRQSENLNKVAAATVALVELWDKAGLYEEAAELLAEIERDFRHASLPGGETGLEYVRKFDRQRLTWAALKNRGDLKGTIKQPVITDVGCWAHDFDINESFAARGRHFVTASDSPFILLDKGNATQSQIALIDRQTSLTVGKVTVPALSTYPARIGSRETGHLFPLGSASTMHGVSLLENWRTKPIWSAVPPASNRQPHEMMRVGPIGVSYCTFQSRSRLVVVDPVEGRVLWQRTELPNGSGLFNGTSYGLLGDQDALVLFHSNGADYTVFDTRTGEVLATRKQTEVPFQRHYAFGRMLLFLTPSETEDETQVLKLWDPVSDSIVFESTTRQKLLTVLDEEAQFAFVTPDYTLRIVDVATGKCIIESRLDPKDVESANRFSVFADAGHYYVNIPRFGIRREQSNEMELTSSFISESYIPTESVMGEFLVFDRSSGEFQWKRTFPQRSFLQPPFINLPFLISASQIKHELHGSQRSIVLELIDKKTGTTLAKKENIGVDQFLQFAYDRDSRRIDIRCKNRVIKINFDTPVPTGPFYAGAE